MEHVETWWDVVEIGAAGQVARARRRLAVLHDDAGRDAHELVSLIHSTRASLTRQAGGHAIARIGDGAAFAALAGRAG
ncbi:MAG: hypothetical protein QM658_17970, partial [Gordonia sp. (in: high G+C Gram-positive bacteria)]